MNCNQFECRNGYDKRRNGTSVELQKWLTTVFVHIWEWRWSDREMAHTGNRLFTAKSRLQSRNSWAAHECVWAWSSCVNWPASVEGEEVWKHYPCGFLSSLSLMWWGTWRLTWRNQLWYEQTPWSKRKHCSPFLTWKYWQNTKKGVLLKSPYLHTPYLHKHMCLSDTSLLSS